MVNEKFKAMLHYIISKCGSKPNVGKTVLYKLCYFSDFDFYELYETKMTGATYVHYPNGPAPQPFMEAVSSLVEAKLIRVDTADYMGREQQKFISLKEPDMSSFSKEEIAAIDSAIERYSGYNASQISEISHKDTPWAITGLYEPLDYEAVFYRDVDLSVRTYDDEDE